MHSLSLKYVFPTQAASHLNPNAVVWTFGLQTSTGALLLYCYIGSLTTISFFRYGDAVYEFDWFEMPIELRKFIQLVIADAQRPLFYTGLNLVDLNLLTFVKVNEENVEYSFLKTELDFNGTYCFFDKSFQLSKTVVTYYMMLRRLAK